MDGSASLQKIQTACLLILTAVALGFAFYWLKPVLVPFVLALLFTYCLIPIIDIQMFRLRLPHWVAVVTTFLLGCLILALLAMLVFNSANQMSENAGDYHEQFKKLQDGLIAYILFERLGIEKDSLDTSVLTISHEQIESLAKSAASTITNLVSSGLLVLVFVFFILAGRRLDGKPTNNRLLREIETSVKRYILLKVVISVFTGLAHGLLLKAFGVEFAMIFGLLAFFLNFIPNLGPVLAILVPLPMILLNPALTPPAMAAVLVLTGAVQFISGNVVEPRLMGESFGLHPVTVLLALIFFGMLWSIIGMFLATPLTAVVKILLAKIPMTEPIAEALAGRFPDDDKEKNGETKTAASPG